MNVIHNYDVWRDAKIKNATTNINECFVEIRNPQFVTQNEIKHIQMLCKNNNFALIQTPQLTNYSQDILAINRQLGLVENDKHYLINNDSLARITKCDDKKNGEFIPYTDRKLNWHTDGYYNDAQHTIRSFSLFCVNQAHQGGENKWLDIEMLYILLREKNPQLTQLLSKSAAMTIPQHAQDGKVLRPESVGAIFFMDKQTDSLYMRYTQRKKNIIFDSEVLEAIEFLDETLATISPYHFEYKMQKNQGIINNNVIHTRNSFVNNEKNPRLMLRGRYFVRV